MFRHVHDVNTTLPAQCNIMSMFLLCYNRAFLLEGKHMLTKVLSELFPEVEGKHS